MVEMYERRHQPLASRAHFLGRVRRSVVVFAIVVTGSLALGTLGYRALADLPWIDALLNAAMILTGMGRTSATNLAVRLGRGVAVVMAVLGLFYNPMLLLIAAFVWFAGAAEARATRTAEYVRPSDWYGGFVDESYPAALRRVRVGSRMVWIDARHFRAR